MVIIIFCVSNKKINFGVFCAVAMAFLHFFDDVSWLKKSESDDRRYPIVAPVMRILFGIPNCGEPVQHLGHCHHLTHLSIIAT